MLNSRDRTTGQIVIAALRRYAATIREEVAIFHGDPSRSEELDAAIRGTRTMRSATSLIGSFALNRVVSLLEELLESVAGRQHGLDDEALDLVARLLGAIESHAESGLQAPSSAEAESRQQLIGAIKAYRRYRDLPEHDDDRAIDSTLSIPPAFSPADGSSSRPGQDPSAPAADTASPGNEVDDPADVACQPDVPPELWEVFREEAGEHIDRIYGALRELTADHENPALIQAVRRSAHTLKGAAGAVGLRVVSRLAHRMEDLLDEIYAGNVALTAELLDLLASTTDMLQDLCCGEFGVDQQQKLTDLYAAYDRHCQVVDTPAGSEPASRSTENAPSNGQQPAQQGADPNAAPSAASASPGGRQASFVRVGTDRLRGLERVVSEFALNGTSLEQGADRIRVRVAELQPVLEMVCELSQDVDQHREHGGLSPLWTPLTAADDPGAGDRDPHEAELFDELQLERFTRLDLWSQSLLEISDAIASIRRDLRLLSDECQSLLVQQKRLTSEIQHRLLEIQMVPVRTIVPRLHRVLREVATREGKDVELVVEGDEVELDKTLLEQLVEPLSHLLRNAVDHGVETAALRAETEKPSPATVRISLSHYGTQVVIRVADDGRGLDAQKIRETAVSRGQIGSSEAETASDQELFRYIFLPGFSTAASVDEISGRGVGMDVVGSKVEELHGRIDVDSVRGQGTLFTIRLPVSLATTRALMLTAGDELYGIPQSAVHSIVRLPTDEVEAGQAASRVHVNNRETVLVRLCDYLGLEPSQGPSPDTVLIALLGSHERQIALQVDGILPGRDVVVQPLASHLGQAAGLLGGAILSNGTVVPILDPLHLLDCGPSRSHLASADDRIPSGHPVTVMIVDDSPSVRSVLQSVVEHVGWTAVPARDGVDALETLASLDQPPDVFLLDVEMPRMDGFELLRTLREEVAFAETPVIMITSRSGDKHRQEAMRFGATAFFTKPFQPETLLETVREVLHLPDGAAV